MLLYQDSLHKKQQIYENRQKITHQVKDFSPLPQPAIQFGNVHRPDNGYNCHQYHQDHWGARQSSRNKLNCL